MRRISGGIGAVVAALILCLSGCGDQELPFAPAAVPEAPTPFFTYAPAPGYHVLRWNRPLRKDVTSSRIIGERGGIIRLKRAGVELVIPPGALTTPTRITATALAGDFAAVVFAPHGLQFAQPATIRVRINATNARSEGYSSFMGVYFVGDTGGPVAPLETFTAPATRKNFLLSIDHFSGYVTMGG